MSAYFLPKMKIEGAPMKCSVEEFKKNYKLVKEGYYF